MKILANYGYKEGNYSYSVTFESIGEVSKSQASHVADELFSMAKTAIERQVKKEDPVKNMDDPFEFPPTSPEPLDSTRDKLRRREVNGNGKPQLKDPEAPATLKQKSLIVRLAKEKGQFIEDLNSFTMEMASKKIEELLAV